VKIISIGTDESLLIKNSRTYERISDVAFLFTEYVSLVFTNNKKFKIIKEERDGNFFIVIPVYGSNKFSQVLRLFKIIKVLAAHSTGVRPVIFSQDAFEIGFLSWVLSKKYKLKLLVQIHTDISSKFFKRESLRNYFQFLLSKFVLKRADSVRVVSNKMKSYLENNFKLKKVFLLPIFTDVSKFTARPPGVSRGQLTPGGLQGEACILMLSRIEEVKNIPLGIRAVQAFRRVSGRDIKLRIVGKGDLKQKYLSIYKNRDWIEWADWTDNVEQEYHNADMLLVTSNYEGWGLTAVESVACGTPVAISPVGVANEFIINGVNGVVSRGHDIINIMEAIYFVYETDFDEKKMKESLKTLGTKEEYLQNNIKMFNMV
jgi:glycosyltransferase involved in cell wall biosynthesis